MLERYNILLYLFNFYGVTTNIKMYRAKHNLTQDDLAQKVGVRRETIVFLEQGKYIPSLKLAWDIARTFDVAIEDLFDF